MSPREKSKATSFQLIHGDFLEHGRGAVDDAFDLAIADPPYGATGAAQWQLPKDHALPGMGGRWDLANHEWDRISGLESLRFTMAWLAETARLVKPSGSIWIHSTYHNSGIVNVACQMLGLEIINEVVWYKRNAFPNLSGRRLTASHETILWVHTGGAKKRDYRFNYEDMKAAAWPYDGLKRAGKQLRTVWDIPNNKQRYELAFGKHPTQKPLRLSKRLIRIAGLPGGRLLVPFAGSGTEMVAALQLDMVPTGYEVDADYLLLARERLEHELRERSPRPRSAAAAAGGD